MRSQPERHRVHHFKLRLFADFGTAEGQKKDVRIQEGKHSDGVCQHRRPSRHCRLSYTEAVRKFFAPAEVAGNIVIIVAIVGLLGN
jgi:hypothetical protein